jgi:hypothetical protein
MSAQVDMTTDGLLMTMLRNASIEKLPFRLWDLDIQCRGWSLHVSELRTRIQVRLLSTGRRINFDLNHFNVPA